MKKSTADKIARLLARVVDPTVLTITSVALILTGHPFAAWALMMISTALLVGAARILGRLANATAKESHRGNL